MCFKSRFWPKDSPLLWLQNFETASKNTQELFTHSLSAFRFLIYIWSESFIVLMHNFSEMLKYLYLNSKSIFIDLIMIYRNFFIYYICKTTYRCRHTLLKFEPRASCNLGKHITTEFYPQLPLPPAVAQASLVLKAVLLPQLPESWDCKEPPYPMFNSQYHNGLCFFLFCHFF